MIHTVQYNKYLHIPGNSWELLCNSTEKSMIVNIVKVVYAYFPACLHYAYPVHSESNNIFHAHPIIEVLWLNLWHSIQRWAWISLSCVLISPVCRRLWAYPVHFESSNIFHAQAIPLIKFYSDSCMHAIIIFKLDGSCFGSLRQFPSAEYNDVIISMITSGACSQ